MIVCTPLYVAHGGKDVKMQNHKAIIECYWKRKVFLGSKSERNWLQNHRVLRGCLHSLLPSGWVIFCHLQDGYVEEMQKYIQLCIVQNQTKSITQ